MIYIKEYNFYKKKKLCHHIHHIKPCNYGLITCTFDKIFGTYYLNSNRKDINFKIHYNSNLFPRLRKKNNKISSI